MKFVDTNIFIRFLAADDEKKSEACYRLFQAVQQGHETVATSESVIAEVAYVLSSPSLYALSNDEIAARLTPILSLRGLRLTNKRTYLRALEIFAANAWIDFEDALSVAHMKRLRLSEIISYDRDFDTLSGVARVEP